MKKINITQVKKAITKNGEWNGYLLGNKTNPNQINNGWCLGIPVCIKTIAQIGQLTNEFLYYLPSELGNRVSFYEEGKDDK